MFVKSKMNIPAKYNKGSDCIVLKPNTITFVDDTKVTAKELLDCYGQRIDIISDGVIEAEGLHQQVVVEEPKAEAKLEERKEDLTLDSLNSILAEIEDGEKVENKEEIEFFLNGETDELPEGTEEITNEEAEELEKVAKVEIKEEKKTEVKKEEKKTTKTASKKPAGKKKNK